jgi:hypothetical protein
MRRLFLHESKHIVHVELCISAEVGRVRRQSVGVQGSDSLISSQIKTVIYDK